MSFNDVAQALVPESHAAHTEDSCDHPGRITTHREVGRTDADCSVLITGMKVEIVRIGDLRAFGGPSNFIEQCGFGDTVQLHIENGRLVVSADRAPRQGWAEAFQAAGSAAGDELLLEPSPENRFNRQEWDW